MRAYCKRLGLPGVGIDECQLGLDLNTARFQFLIRLPHALSFMARPAKPAEEKRLAQFQTNLAIMTGRIQSLCDRMSALRGA